jgi:hypothetical protein
MQLKAYRRRGLPFIHCVCAPRAFRSLFAEPTHATFASTRLAEFSLDDSVDDGIGFRSLSVVVGSPYADDDSAVRG